MEYLLEAKQLQKNFQQNKKEFRAVDNVSFSVGPGECVGIAGESGSGKSTVAKMVTRLLETSKGELLWEGKDYTHASGKELQAIYRGMQMIFQSPQDSFNPHLRLEASVTEGLRNRGVSKEEAHRMAVHAFADCGLPAEYLKRYPHEISGGECQRAAIARAIVLEPKLLICDEATSALDVTVQAQVMKLLGKLRKDRGIAFLFISHDLALMQQFCDRILVMYKGKVVEEGTAWEVLARPKEAYTKKLVESAIFQI